jgi:hypothetical protein
MKLRGLVPNFYINVSTGDLFISTFLGPKWHSPNGSRPFHRAQKSLDFKAQPLRTCPCNASARIKSITYGAVYS